MYPIQTNPFAKSVQHIYNCWKLWDTWVKETLRPSKKKKMFFVRISIRKEAGGRFFFFIFIPIAFFLYTLWPSPRDTSELLGQILMKRNIRYRLNTSLFNFDTHKGWQWKFTLFWCVQSSSENLHFILTHCVRTNEKYFLNRYRNLPNTTTTVKFGW